MSGKVTRRDFMTQVALLVGSKTALLRCAGAASATDRQVDSGSLLEPLRRPLPQLRVRR